RTPPVAARADGAAWLVEASRESHGGPSNRPRTAREPGRLLRQQVLPRWGGRMVHEITRRDVLDALDRVVDGGAPIAANRVFAAVRKFFNWCVARDIIAASPCAGVKPPTAERARDRVLSDEELKLVWQAAGKVGSPFGPLVKLLALTGQRRDEVARMRWDELDLDACLWTLPPVRTKNDKPHDVPLSAAAITVLKTVPRVTDSPFVLTTNGAAPASGYSKNKRRLDAQLPADMPSWRLHDLRRTAASGMARLGINLPVIEKVLNHASGSFAGIVSVDKDIALQAVFSVSFFLAGSHEQAIALTDVKAFQGTQRQLAKRLRDAAAVIRETGLLSEQSAKELDAAAEDCEYDADPEVDWLEDRDPRLIVKRHQAPPHVVAYCVRLAHVMGRIYGDDLRGTVAVIATTALNHTVSEANVRYWCRENKRI